jgi:bifunctional non-homologous end joining protein LigD
MSLLQHVQRARAACSGPAYPASADQSVVYIGVDLDVDDEKTMAAKIAVERAAGWKGKIELIAWPPPMDVALENAVLGFVGPCIPSRALKQPSGPNWRDGPVVRLFTRRGHDWDRYPAIAAAARQASHQVVHARRRSSCRRNRRRRRVPCPPPPAQPWSDGEDLRLMLLSARKAKLARLLARKPAGIVFNEQTEEDGAVVFRHACKMGLEGIRVEAAPRALSVRTIAGLAVRPWGGSTSATTRLRAGKCRPGPKLGPHLRSGPPPPPLNS